ncbi:MAG: hypothetical protein ACKO6N_14600, partial [Myxococcota bacterium]
LPAVPGTTSSAHTVVATSAGFEPTYRRTTLWRDELGLINLGFKWGDDWFVRGGLGAVGGGQEAFTTATAGLGYHLGGKGLFAELQAEVGAVAPLLDLREPALVGRLKCEVGLQLGKRFAFLAGPTLMLARPQDRNALAATPGGEAIASADPMYLPEEHKLLAWGGFQMGIQF